MKKKIALLLSAIMVLSPISVFAESSNTLSRTLTASNSKSLFMEESWGDEAVNLKPNNDETKEVEYVLGGTTLYIRPTNGNIKAGDTIKLSLENAKWFFRHNTSNGSGSGMSFDKDAIQAQALKTFVEKYGIVKTTDATANTAGAYKNKITLNPDGIRYGINTSWFEQIATSYIDPAELVKIDATASDILITDVALAAAGGTTVAVLLGAAFTMTIPLATTDFTKSKMIERIAAESNGKPDFSPNTSEVSTYDIRNGIYFPTTSTYVRYNNFVGGGGAVGVAGAGDDIAYTLTMSSYDEDVATLRFFRDYNAGDFTNVDRGIPFPLVSLSKGEGDCRVNIGDGSNLTTISSNKFQYALTSSTNTTTSVSEKVQAKYNFPLKHLQIKEKVPYSIQQGKVTVTAPYGYYFADPKIVIYDDDSNEENQYTVLRASEGLFFKDNETKLENETLTVNGNKVGRYIDYGYETDSSGNPNFAKPIKDRIVINTNTTPFPGLPSTETGLGLQHSSRTNGVLSVEGLTLIAQDYAPFDRDIVLRVEGDGVTKEDFVIGTRKDWGVGLKTITAVPKLISGRLTEEKNSSEFDKDHKTADVKFSENIVASWWALRETSFVLSEGSKFIKVEIEEEENFNHTNTSNVLNGVYHPASERTSYVSLDSKALNITDLEIKKDKVASFEMQTWVSIEPGFEGDVALSLEKGRVSEDVESVRIARAVSPITITSKVTDVKIGYQWQKVADFTISETEPGALKRNTTVELFIDDNITGSDSIALAPDFITEVNSDSKILFSKPTILDGRLSFTIERFSYDKAATIKFSNVYVKIDRTVPESNKRPYQIVAGGDAIAANYSKRPGSYEPKFVIKGIGTDFLNVVTSANDKDSILSNVVRVTIGSNEVLLGREGTTSTVLMDTSAYISPISNSTMVPVRFVSQALGIPDNQILWDNDNRTVTIYNGARIIQFKIGSSEININGVTTTMYSPDMTPLKVQAEVKDERAFLPFRALGNALGVSVDWDTSTQTAVFNADLLDADQEETKETEKKDETNKTTVVTTATNK